MRVEVAEAERDEGRTVAVVRVGARGRARQERDAAEEHGADVESKEREADARRGQARHVVGRHLRPLLRRRAGGERLREVERPDIVVRRARGERAVALPAADEVENACAGLGLGREGRG